MRCAKCPLYESWSTENDYGENCVLFGDAWDSNFQYEDKDGTVQGCYIEKAYIDKVDKQRCDYYSEMAKAYEESLKSEDKI